VTEDVYARYAESLRVGHQQAAEGKFKDALASYQAAASYAGERALPHIAIGGMHLRLGQRKEALEAYDRALALEPDNLDALTGRAAALLAAGRRGDADAVRKKIDQLRGVGTAQPAGTDGNALPLTGAEAHAVAGEQARSAGHKDAAIDAWLAESREHVRLAHYDAALDACLRALALDSGSTRVHLELVRVYFKRGWHDQAVERALLLDRLLSLSPDPDTRAGLRAVVVDNATGDPRVAQMLAADGATPVES
jgi:tetratricopeptide (TPR) repeat protein